MEIPHVSQFENKAEKLPGIDFLDNNLKVSFSIDPEAAAYLPDIEDKEFETKKEKYRVLLGNIHHLSKDEINIEVKGMLEADEDEKDLFYNEGEGHVSPNIAAIKKWVASIQYAVPEYQDYHFVGDVHTHPVRISDLNEGSHPCDPSIGDFENISKEYHNGNLSADKPFIFCIAGKVNNQMLYAFYRFVRKDDKYTIEKIEQK
jgi:hypothetical protein